MTHLCTLEEARTFAYSLEACRSLGEVDVVYVTKAMYILGNNGDRDAFRRIVDNYSRLCKTHNSEEVRKDPLDFVEWLCASADHGFTKVGYRSMMIKMGLANPLPVLKTQQLFRELYGTHFG